MGIGEDQWEKITKTGCPTALSSQIRSHQIPESSVTRYHLCKFRSGHIQLDSLSNGKEIGCFFHIATVVVVLLAEVEITVVGVCCDDSLTSFFEIEESVGCIGAVGTGSGGGFGAGSVVD